MVIETQNEIYVDYMYIERLYMYIYETDENFYNPEVTLHICNI